MHITNLVEWEKGTRNELLIELRLLENSLLFKWHSLLCSKF